MSHFANDFEAFDRKTAISTNIYGHVTGTKVKMDQCLCRLLRVLRVYTPKGGVARRQREGLATMRPICLLTTPLFGHY
jgi:hypothetical protein